MTDFYFDDLVISAPVAGAPAEKEKEEGGEPEQIPSFWGNNYEAISNTNSDAVGDQHAATAAAENPLETVGINHKTTAVEGPEEETEGELEQIPSHLENNDETNVGDTALHEQATIDAVHDPPEPVESHHATVAAAGADTETGAATAMDTSNVQAIKEEKDVNEDVKVKEDEADAQQQDGSEAQQQHQHQQMEQSAAKIAAPQINTNSGVDGIGMWKSWTHNYVEAKFACMDLLDNCFDATLRDDFAEQGFQGKVAMNYLAPNGIVILNNSGKAIKSLEETLTAYRSEKNSATVMDDNCNPLRKDAIGEYGVGLKQACATLSDTSFVLTRNKNVFDFGVIAQALQTRNSVLLPHFAFTVQSETAQNILSELKEHISKIVKDNKHVGQLVTRELGAGNRTFGVKRLVDQCLAMWTGEWESRDYVFQLIISDIKHTSIESAQTSVGTNNHPANRFLETIRRELPEHYINVPQTGFDLHIRDKKVGFTFWQDRLVEMTKFEVHIPKDIPVQQMADDSGWEHTGYPLSIYCGFDALRLEDKSQAKACQLYTYSRQSGRLIETATDARDSLGMTAAGVEFSQGLTIIVDDHKGELPLKPTKDGLTWSKQASGEIHKSNLLAWVGAVAFVYWKHHALKFETKWLLKNEYKRHLREAVEKFLGPIKKRLRDKGDLADNNDSKTSEDLADGLEYPINAEGQGKGTVDTVKRLENENFTMFSDVFWTKKQSENSLKVTIRKKRNLVSWKGCDTLYSFDQERDYPKPPEKHVAKAPGIPKRAAAKPIVRRVSQVKKRKYSTIHLKPVVETPTPDSAPLASASDSSSGNESEEEIIPKPSRAKTQALKRPRREVPETDAVNNSNVSLNAEYGHHDRARPEGLQLELQRSQEQMQTLEAELLQARRQLLYKPQQDNVLRALQTSLHASKQENVDLKKELLQTKQQLLLQPVPANLERPLQAAMQEIAWLKEQKEQLELQKNQRAAASAQGAHEVSTMKLDIERLSIELKRQKTINEQLLQGGDQTVYPGAHEADTNDGFLDLGNGWL